MHCVADTARRTILTTVLGFALLAQPAFSQSITADEANAIATDAYLYFYPLVTMDITRKQLTNQEVGKSPIAGPMNMFVNVAAFPPPT